MTKTQAEIHNSAIEQAAKIAAPAYAKDKPGQWAQLRIRLADEIRSCKLKIEGA